MAAAAGRTRLVVGEVLAALALLAGCGGAEQAGPASPEVTLTSSPTPGSPGASIPTPSALPTTPGRPATSPTAPPRQPTDVVVRSRVEGSVVEPSAPGCVDLLADTGVRWTLVGDLAQGLQVGQRVRLTVRGVPEGQGPSCAGVAARVESVTVLA